VSGHHRPPPGDTNVNDLERAIEQIKFSRFYTQRFLDTIDPADWFRTPGAVTHVAWQTGHIAFAEYRLALFRIRGQKPGDADLISEGFLQLFNSRNPPHEAAHYPTVAEIRATLDRVHARVLEEVPAYGAALLAEPTNPEHPIAKTKMASLFWCAQHELVHAGQIALLRRELGLAPIW
jgi:hypothetical protein